MTINGAEVNARPFSRVGEALEVVPGLMVTQHSGEGKANQYFLRGYNLDHGTDLAIYVDDVPVNMRTHAHGQGYADLNWLLPETVNALEIRKGHQLVTHGVYRSIRHPMYASIWIWCLAQGLLLENWLAGWYALFGFALMYFLRTPREEQLMCQTFGQEYRDYMRRTGRLFPRRSGSR